MQRVLGASLVPLSDCLSGQGGICLVESERGQVTRQPVFDPLKPDQSLAAALDVLLTSEAVDVRVLLVIPAPGVHDSHSPSTASAVQHGLQRVVVLSRLVAAAPPTAKQVLHRLERRPVNQRLVAPVVLHALESHKADVEAVREHPLQRRLVDRSGWEAGCRAQRKTAVRQRRTQAVETDDPLRELVESPADMVGPLRIEHHDPDVLTVGLVAAVQIADRCLARHAAEFGLLLHALLGLKPEVAGVELGD